MALSTDIRTVLGLTCVVDVLNFLRTRGLPDVAVTRSGAVVRPGTSVLVPHDVADVKAWAGERYGVAEWVWIPGKEIAAWYPVPADDVLKAALQ